MQLLLAQAYPKFAAALGFAWALGTRTGTAAETNLMS